MALCWIWIKLYDKNTWIRPNGRFLHPYLTVKERTTTEILWDHEWSRRRTVQCPWIPKLVTRANGRLVASIVNQAGSFKTNIPSHGQTGNLNLSQAMLQPTCSNTLLWIYPYLCDARVYNCVCVITSPSFAHFWANHHDGYTNSPYTIFMLIIGMLKILNSSITKLFLILWDILEACKPGQTI